MTNTCPEAWLAASPFTFGNYFVTFVEQLQGLSSRDTGGHRTKIIGRFRGRNREGLNHQNPAIELKALTYHLPVASAHVLLLDQELATFVEPAQNAPAEVHIFEQRAINLGDAYRFRIDQHVALHALIDHGFVVRGIELRVWLKGEVYERGAIRARLLSGVGVEKRIGQTGQHKRVPLVFLLVRLPSFTTRLGIVGELL